jgi:hypothetical protein
MVRSSLLCLLLAAGAFAQDPFVPLKLDDQTAILDRNGARQDWVKLTNQRMEMAGRTLRVAVEGNGLTAVVLAKDLSKPRHAKPILLGSGDYAELFNTIRALGFTRIVARNPDSGREWAARLERGKPILEK